MLSFKLYTYEFKLRFLSTSYIFTERKW